MSKTNSNSWKLFDKHTNVFYNRFHLRMIWVTRTATMDCAWIKLEFPK